MDAVLRPELDLRDAVEAARREGIGAVADALTAGALEPLRAELSALPFEPAPPPPGPVRQESEVHVVRSFAELPALRALALELGRRLRALGRGPRAIQGLATWRCNDAYVQRYAPGSIGITSHRDGRRYRRLVASLTLEGRARFVVRETREGAERASVPVAPGALVLLRAPGLDGLRDGRPFHALEPRGAEPRLSVVLTMVREARAPRAR